MNEKLHHLRTELSKQIIGHKNLVDSLLIGLFSQGHILIEGVPGLAKTTAVNALARAIGLDFKRVQFTPDLLPTDILGAEIYHPKTEEFVLKKGAIFTNLLLCDEINRASAKVQSALLEVMQEKQVTIGEHSFKVDEPFLVLATQNPIDQEGTYTLPEAQLDRFMMKVTVGYNTEAEEFEIAKKAANHSFEPISQVITQDDLAQMQKEVEEIYIDDAITTHIIQLIFATRTPAKYGLESLEEVIAYGASPRASIDMIKAVKASAYLRGNKEVSPIDIALCAKNVLRHRISLTYEAQVDDLNVDDIIDTLTQNIEIA
jgi:MoxR-like ATPase